MKLLFEKQVPKENAVDDPDVNGRVNTDKKLDIDALLKQLEDHTRRCRGETIS